MQCSTSSKVRQRICVEVHVEDSDNEVEVLDLSQEDEKPSVCGVASSATVLPYCDVRLKTCEKSNAARYDESEEDDDLLLMSPVFQTRAAAPFSTTRNSSSKLLSVEKHVSRTIQLRKQSEKTATAQERKRAKEAEKTQKAQERENVKQMKVQHALHKKQEKRTRTDQEKQSDGKFASAEICLLIRSESFMEKEPLGLAITNAFKEKGYASAILPYEESAIVHTNNNVVGSGAVLFQWVRKDYILGGSNSAAMLMKDLCCNADITTTTVSCDPKEGTQQMSIVSVIFHDPSIFLKMLERDASAERIDDYPLLRVWLEGVRRYLAQYWDGNLDGNSCQNNGVRRPRSRIVLVLHNVQAELSRQWNSGGRRRQSFHPISEDELQDAMVWLMIEQQTSSGGVECTMTSSIEETTEYILNLTRCLSESPYYEDASELHCVKKIKSHPGSGITTDLETAKECWVKQLQQLPLMSEAKARRLTDRYPTLMSLADAYEDPNLTTEEKRSLVANDLVEGRTQTKLSDQLYQFMTGKEPNQLL